MIASSASQDLPRRSNSPAPGLALGNYSVPDGLWGTSNASTGLGKKIIRIDVNDDLWAMVTIHYNKAIPYRPLNSVLKDAAIDLAFKPPDIELPHRYKLSHIWQNRRVQFIARPNYVRETVTYADLLNTILLGFLPWNDRGRSGSTEVFEFEFTLHRREVDNAIAAGEVGFASDPDISEEEAST